MTPEILLIVVSACVALFACYLGAGVILHPPKMSKLEIFPELYGLPYEKVSFRTKDGLTLKGWFLPSPKGEADQRTLLMCHGWGDNKGELLRDTRFLSTHGGFNLLYFDNRSHGESDGEITTIGYLEIGDLEAAVAFLKETKPWALKRLGVFGLSMGAAVAAMASPNHPEIRAAVLESPFPSFRNVVRRWTWNHTRVPYWPLLPIVFFFLRRRVGSPKVDTYSPVRFIGNFAPRPLLIIGGTEDRLMPPGDVKEVFDAAREPKQLWMVTGAAHGKCWEVAGLEYETRVIGFFDKHL